MPTIEEQIAAIEAEIAGRDGAEDVYADMDALRAAAETLRGLRWRKGFGDGCEIPPPNTWCLIASDEFFQGVSQAHHGSHGQWTDGTATGWYGSGYDWMPMPKPPEGD